MRILFVSHHFPPIHTAGTETYAYNLAQRFIQNHELMVFHTEKRVSLKQYDLLHSEVDGIPTRILINNLIRRDFGETFINPPAEEAFLKVLKEFRPHIVHIHHLMYSSLRLPELARKEGVPVVMTLHDFFLVCPRGGRFMLPNGENCEGPIRSQCLPCLSALKYRQGRWEAQAISLMARVRSLTGLDLTGLVYGLRDKVFKKDLTKGTASPIKGDPEEKIAPWLDKREEVVQELFNAVSCFMTPSETVGDALKTHGLPQEKLRLWRYGIDLKPFQGIQRSRRTAPVFGCFGSYMPHKGVHLLVEAAASLKREEATCLIRGPEEQNPAYVRRLKEAAGPSTLFRPGYSRGEVRRAFEEIDLLVLPSLWLENSPVVIQEAFACGCPVITSDLGGMRELVEDGVNGRLFPPGDATALKAVLLEAAGSPETVEAWRAGVKPPRSIEDDVKSLEGLYGDLIKRDT